MLTHTGKHIDSTKGHVNNIPTMQLFTGISRYTQLNSYIPSLTECVWVFQNNALSDTHGHALLETSIWTGNAVNLSLILLNTTYSAGLEHLPS